MLQNHTGIYVTATQGTSGKGVNVTWMNVLLICVLRDQPVITIMVAILAFGTTDDEGPLFLKVWTFLSLLSKTTYFNFFIDPLFIYLFFSEKRSQT